MSIKWQSVILFGLATVLNVLPQPAVRAQAQETPRAPLRNMLVLNEDDSHFFGTRKPEDMTLEGLNAFVDQYANSTITHLFLCPNAQRASFRSSTRDAIWDPVNGVEPQDLWPQNGKRLFESGLDPYAIWIARCRETKISPWLSMRMNDVHSVDDESHFLHSTFWHEHHEYWRVPHGSAAPWVNRALNYAHAAVREHQMRFVLELLERYDADGLELDWMRFGYHLTPGREKEEATILTQFVRDVRAATEKWATKRGHPIYLGVRVPAHPDAAAGLGMDAIKWAQEGLVDMIVPCPFWSSSDFDIPVELWRERLGEKQDLVTVAPGLEYNSRPSPGGEAVANDLACARGFAASARYRGADSLYLFNWMDSETRPVPMSDYERLLREGLSAEAIARAERRFPVCYRDTVPGDFPNGVQLPFAAQEGREIQIPIGPAPSPTDTVWAVVGLSDADSTPTTEWTASLNGKPLVPAEPFAEPKQLGGPSVCAIRFACPIEAVIAGVNKLSLRRSAAAPPRRVVWTELRIVPAETAVTFPGQTSDWNGYTRYDFTVDGRPVLVVAPKQAAPGRPWVWHGEFFGHKPAPDIALLGRGFHIVHMSVPDMLGGPQAVAHWNAFYRELTEKYGFAKKAALVGLSRGGLYCYNWACANPDKVACIYADAAVCDFKSWPGGKGKGKGSPGDWQLVMQCYGFANEAEAMAYDKNPVDNLRPLAEAHVPLLHIYGDADDAVPWEENTGIIAERYKQLGGQITLIAKPGVGHHPHGLDDPTPIVEFIQQHSTR